MPSSGFLSSASMTKMFTMRRMPARIPKAPITRNSSVASRPIWTAWAMPSAFTEWTRKSRWWIAMLRRRFVVTLSATPRPSATPPMFEIRISNIGGVADGLGVADNVTTNLRLSIAIHHLDLRVHSVKADGIAQAVQIGRDATELFLVMGAFGILAGILLIVNIFVML